MEVHHLTETYHESMVDTLRELHAYYNGREPDGEATRNHLLNNLLDPAEALQLLVAIDPKGNIAGFAAISYVYSLVEPFPENNRQCAMKELFVRSSYRGQSVGHLLMEAVAREAIANNCARIDWPVKAANVRGIAFYERLGAALVEDRLSYRLEGDRLLQLSMATTL